MQRLLLDLLLTCLLIFSVQGCRAIRHSADNRQSIEARRLSREGLAAIYHNRWDEAEDLFTDALKLSKTDDRAFSGYGEVLWQKGLHVDAIKNMEMAVRLSASAPELIVRLGNMYLEQGRVKEAAQQADRALEITNNLAPAWALRAATLVRVGNASEALAAYHRALAIDGQNDDVRLAVAALYRREDRFERVLATLDQISEEDLKTNELATVAFLKGAAMSQLGQPAKGSKYLQQAIALGLRNPETLFEFAKAEYADGKTANANEAVREILRIEPAHQETLRLAEEIRSGGARLAETLPSDGMNNR